MGECARGMEQCKNVVMRDVPTLLSKEEFVWDISLPRKRSAAMKVVPIMLREVEYVGDMGQRKPFRLADIKDVPIG